MAKFNLPKPAIFKPTKSLHSAGGFGGGGDVTNNITNNTYYTGDPFGYSSTTNPSGIGIAEVRFNSTTFGSITKMYVSDNDQNSVDLVAEQSIMTSGVAKLYKAGGGKLSFQVTRMVDQSGYFEYDVAPLSGIMPTVGEVCYVDFVPDAPGVRVYKVLLNQTGTYAPAVTEQRNSLTGTPASSYVGVGEYRLTLSGAFPVAKTTAILQSNMDPDATTFLVVKVDASGNFLTVMTGTGQDLQDDNLINTCLVVEVEP